MWWFLLFVPLSFARPKTDSVTLVNGNNITCEIRGLSRGVLNAKTDSLSSVSIRWQDVVRIQSEFIFEIILSDGSAHYGGLSPGPGGNLQITGEAAIPLLRVVTLTPIRYRFGNRFDGAVDIGYSYLKSNSTTQVNFDGELGYTMRRRSLQAEFSDILVLREETSATRRDQGDLAFNQTLSRGFFAMVIGQSSTNDELNLIHRYLGGGAFGRYLVRTNRSIVSVYGGGAYSSERYAATERRNNGEALLGTTVQFFRLYSPKLDIGGVFRLWPNLTTSGRFRIDASTKARVEVYKNLFVSFSLFDNYDRKSPSTAMPRNDYGLVTAVGYSFNR